MGAIQSNLGTISGWTTIAVLGLIIWYRSNRRNNAREQMRIAAQRHREQERQEVQARKDSKAKRQRLESFTGAPKQAKAQNQPKSQSLASKKDAAADSSDDDNDNREFAKQFSQVKEGTKFTNKATNEQKSKSIKQSRAQEKKKGAEEVVKVSAPSSTAGVDADDDQSSTASPVVAAADSSGISDMLEKPAAGPSILKLIDTEEKKKPSKPVKAPQAVETKKQRQNRKKVEAAQALRAEEEKIRKVKLEAQRRTAREAAGIPARNGTASTAAPPSVWTGNGANGSSQVKETPDGFLPVQPLDTLENGTQKTNAPKAKSSVPSHGENDWQAALPTEEEQMQMLRDQEDWATVQPKKSKKKNGAVSDNDTAPQAAPATIQPALKQQSSAAPVRPMKTFAQQSSFAALSDDGEEIEQEWEV